MPSHQPYGDKTDRTYLLLTARFRLRVRSLVDMLSYVVFGRESMRGKEEGGFAYIDKEREKGLRLVWSPKTMDW